MDPRASTRRCWIAILPLLVVLGGCSTVSPESAELSRELGTRIRESHRAHLALTRAFFEAKRARVDRFLEQEWVPTFTSALMSDSAVRAARRDVLAAGDPAQERAFFTDLNTTIQRRVSGKRAELVAPVNELESALIERLNTHYERMIEANAALTDLLSTTAALQRRRQQLLRPVAERVDLRGTFDRAERVVDTIVSGRDALEQNRRRIESTIEQLKSLREDRPDE